MPSHSFVYEPERLAVGDKATFISATDGGTPTISDPGSELVSAIRGTFPDMKIVPIAGASAVAAALSLALE